MHRYLAIALALVISLFAACSFESSLVSDVSCAAGDTRDDGAVCQNGFWVGGSDLDGGRADAEDEVDMPSETDAGDSDACAAESDSQFCDRLQKNCGIVEDIDNCGANRQITCGMCNPGDSCTDNVCECVPEDDQGFCDRVSKDCGMVTDDDNCGMERTADCGMCPGNEQCGEQAPNVCGCPCNIDGTCYPDGAANPNDSCEVCDPRESATSWTLDVGRSCDDSDLCTENDVCLGNGSCVGSPKDCSSENGECRTGICDPSTGDCLGMAETGTTCADDGINCTDDLCNAGACEHTLQAGRCLIDVGGTDTCFNNGTPNPSNGCEACVSASSTTDWSTDNGGSCSDGFSCTTDVCSGGSCQSSLAAGRCLIGGTCYNDNDPNPGNSCEQCDSAADSGDWTLNAGSCCSIGGTAYADGTLNPVNDCESCDVNNDTMNWTPLGMTVDCCPAESGSWSCDGASTCLRSNGNTMVCAP